MLIYFNFFFFSRVGIKKKKKKIYKSLNSPANKAKQNEQKINKKKKNAARFKRN
jgi:hypothetical protein